MGKNPYKYGDEEFKRLNRLHKFSGAANKARLEEMGLDINDIPLINKELNKYSSALYNEILEILKPLEGNKIFINNVQIAPHDKIHTDELSLYLSSLNIELFDPYSFKEFLKDAGLLTE